MSKTARQKEQRKLISLDPRTDVSKCSDRAIISVMTGIIIVLTLVLGAVIVQSAILKSDYVKMTEYVILNGDNEFTNEYKALQEEYYELNKKD